MVYCILIRYNKPSYWIYLNLLYKQTMPLNTNRTNILNTCQANTGITSLPKFMPCANSRQLAHRATAMPHGLRPSGNHRNGNRLRKVWAHFWLGYVGMKLGFLVGVLRVFSRSSGFDTSPAVIMGNSSLGKDAKDFPDIPSLLPWGMGSVAATCFSSYAQSSPHILAKQLPEMPAFREEWWNHVSNIFKPYCLKKWLHVPCACCSSDSRLALKQGKKERIDKPQSRYHDWCFQFPGKISVNGLRGVLGMEVAAHGFRVGRHKLPGRAWSMVHGKGLKKRRARGLGELRCL